MIIVGAQFRVVCSAAAFLFQAVLSENNKEFDTIVSKDRFTGSALVDTEGEATGMDPSPVNAIEEENSARLRRATDESQTRQGYAMLEVDDKIFDGALGSREERQWSYYRDHVEPMTEGDELGRLM